MEEENTHGIIQHALSKQHGAKLRVLRLAGQQRGAWKLEWGVAQTFSSSASAQHQSKTARGLHSSGIKVQFATEVCEQRRVARHAKHANSIIWRAAQDAAPIQSYKFNNDTQVGDTLRSNVLYVRALTTQLPPQKVSTIEVWCRGGARGGHPHLFTHITRLRWLTMCLPEPLAVEKTKTSLC